MNNPELAQVFAPKSAETGKPIELAMQRLWLVGRITGVGARLLVKHTFRSGEKVEWKPVLRYSAFSRMGS